MRTRVAASTLLGVALVALVAFATLAVALLVWTRAEDRARIENDRAALTARQALQNSLGRVLATLGGADGLVDEKGIVDKTSFQAFARAVAVLPAADSLTLTEVVPARERASFERKSGVRIVDYARIGAPRPAAVRPTYLPVVSVWPPTRANARLVGVDLLSEPSRRATLRLARASGAAAFTGVVRLLDGRRGLLAFKPLYAPSEQNAPPIGYVSASFSTRVIAEILRSLPAELRVRVVVGRNVVYESEEAPAGGTTRSLVLGGRRWLVTARGESASETAPLAILVAGLTLAALLAAFTSSRASFERRLVRANASEREARERSELMERNAAHLAAATTAEDVAASTVADLASTGIEIAAVHALRGELVEVLATSGITRDENAPPYHLDADTAAAEAIRTGEVVEVVSGEDYDERYPGRAEARQRQGVECLIAVPLRNPDGRVIGTLVAASRQARWLDRGLRLVVTGVAEQCGLALERARLQAIEQDAQRRAGILQHLAARLSAAVLPAEVAEACVPSLFDAFDADACVVTTVSADELNVLSVTRHGGIEQRHWASVSQSTRTPMGDAVEAGTTVEAHDAREIAGLVGGESAAELAGSGIVSLLAIPLPGAAGSIAVAFRQSRVLSGGERELLEAIRDELAQALDRAVLFEGEREARLRAELMERTAAHLAAASTPIEVATATVEDFGASGADVVFVWRLSDPSTLEALASTNVPEDARQLLETDPIERLGLVGDALRNDELAAVATMDEYLVRYPGPADEGRVLGFESMVAVPLRAADGDLVGALFAASRKRHWLTVDRRQLLLGVAEQTGVALERAMLFETEREARRLAELLEQNAAHLAAAATIEDVAESTVADLGHAGFDFATVQMLGRDGIELLAAQGLSQELVDRYRTSPREARSLSAAVIRTGEVIEVGTDEEFERRYPDSAELRRELGAELMLAVPLRAADRRVIGVLRIGAADAQAMTAGRRQVILSVAEQCGLALERARLQSATERSAAEASFIAHLANVLERATTVDARVRRLTELLTDELATFAAVHLLESGEAGLVAVSGSRPVETASDEHWSRYVAQAVATGRPVVPGDDGDGSPSSPTTLPVILPLRARGHVIGALTIRTAADSRWEPSISPAFAREISSRAAVIIDNGLLYERERDVSHSLQLGLLGGGLPAVEGVVITAAYRAGTEALEVGGDWYDAFPLPSGAIGLVVGDVVGHGLEAAVAMGQLRGAVSALAQSARPAALLESLDAFVENVPSAATATVAYVELDAATGRVTYACAGHPPPLVVSADGRTRFLWDGRSAPLGSVLGDQRDQADDRLETGETLVLYTDGLIERRAESLDAGFERLAESATLHPQRGQTLADDICDSLLEGHVQDDDVCVLTVHRLPVLTRTFSHSFAASPSALAPLRERLRTWLEQHNIAIETTLSTVLAVSEAASNAVEHGYRCDGEGIVSVDALLAEDDSLHISVRDRGTWRDGQDDEDRGRGLPIIEAIVDELSIAREDGATVVRMRRTGRNEVPA